VRLAGVDLPVAGSSALGQVLPLLAGPALAAVLLAVSVAGIARRAGSRLAVVAVSTATFATVVGLAVLVGGQVRDGLVSVSVGAWQAAVCAVVLAAVAGTVGVAFGGGRMAHRRGRRR